MAFINPRLISVRIVALATMLSLLLSAFPASFFVALAASTGITTDSESVTTPVTVPVFFKASTVFTDETTPGTFVSVSDDGSGGVFYDANGTTEVCGSVDADNQFSISQNKGICYSNDTPGVYDVEVQLLDGSEGSPIGDPAVVEITVTAVEEPLTPLALTSICRITDGGLRFRVQNTNDVPVSASYEVVGTGDTGAVAVAAAGAGVIKFEGASDGPDYTFFDTAVQTGAGSTKLTYDDGTGNIVTLTKAANNTVCPDPEPEPKDETTIVVTGDDFTLENGGWLFNRDSTTVFEFNDDMASIGDGSLYVGSVSEVPADKFIGENFIQVPVEDIDSFTYDFKIAGTGNSGDANEFYLNVYTNIDESQNFYDCRFDYVPATGSTADFTTVTFDATDTPVNVAKRGSRIANCPATLAEMPAGSFVYFFSLSVGDTTDSDEGLAGYYDNVVLETTSAITTWDFEPVPVDPSLIITAPEIDGETLPSQYTFTGTYVDADDTDDNLAWAIRDSVDSSCNGGTTYAGNTGGFSTDFTFDDGLFASTIDMSTWANGGYCLVLNPQESGNGEDFRAVRTFALENDVNQCTAVVVSDDTNTVVEKAGAFAEILTYNAPTWTTLPGAVWIWGDDPIADLTQNVTQTFEKTFVWNGPINEATLDIGADNSFIARINGELVHQDTTGGTFKAANQLTLDVAEFIEQGENTITVLVTNHADARFDSHLQNPAGLLYRLEVGGPEVNCSTVPTDASLAITNPAADDETLEGEYSFTAEYIDNDEVVDDIAWAIRDSVDNSCNGDTTYAGNVDGFDDESSFVGSAFTALVDMSEWEDGAYCFVVNPQEGEGEEDLRAVRNFFLENPEPLVCAPGVNLLANASFEEPEVTKKRGWDLFGSITGWISARVNGGGTANVELQRGVNGWESSDGYQHTELDAEEAITLSQAVATIEGEEYTLTWDYSPRPGANESENDVIVLVDGAEVAENEGVLPTGDTDWTTHSYTFTGTGDVMEIAFSDDGIDNGLGGFIDNTSLVCNPVPDVAVAPYCGDGVVQTEGQNSWEQCEIGDEGCTDYCLFANQCSYEQLVKITLDDTESASFDGMIYLGTDDAAIPNGTWFNFAEVGDAAFNTIANNVDGLAVERNQEANELKLAFVGGNERRVLDIVAGTIETLGINLGGVERQPNPSFRLEDDVPAFIDVFEKDGDNITFDLRADTGNDGVSVAINQGEKFNCPECLANVEARVVLQDTEGNFGNLGSGNLEQKVVLGDGEVVEFGEWFDIFDGTDFVTDPAMVESFANGDQGGLFVSRTGDGFVKLALYGDHEGNGETNHEFIKGRLEFRDAQLDGSTLTGLIGQYKLENHPENDAIDSNDGFDRVEMSGPDAVEFDLWADTANDGFKVQVHRDTIESCDEDDSTYLIEGSKWNDENGNGVWDDDESGIEGWEIYVEGDDFFETLTTDEDGYYSLEVQAGSYVVFEEDRNGWSQTFPEPYEDDDETWLPDMPLWPEFLQTGYDFGACQYQFGNESKQFSFIDEQNVSQGFTNPDECNFGNQLVEYTIEGYKWNDENGNGVWDDDESGIEGWEIYLAGEGENDTDVTDDSGYYSFTVNSGDWTVSEEQREGWTQTAPFENEAGTCELSLGQLDQGYELNEETIECNFGNQEDDEDTEVNGSSLTCDSFTSNRDSASVGNEITLSWNTTGATNVSIDNEIGDVAVDGSISVFVPDFGTTVTYTLTASDGEDTITCAKNVLVTEPSGGNNSPASFSRGGIVAGAATSSAPSSQVAGEATTNQCGLYLTDYMKIGQPNDVMQVTKLQVFLNQQGFVTPLTGIFDSATEVSVEAFQAVHAAQVLQPWFDLDPAYGLNPTGYVFKTTRWKINDMKCPGIQAFPELP